MKRLIFVAFIILLVLLLAPHGRASNTHVITITGTAATVALTTTDLQASSLQVTAPNANTGIARLGDSTVTSSIGEALPPGSGQYFPPRSQGGYSLKNFSVYVANGDVVTVVWVDTY